MKKKADIVSFVAFLCIVSFVSCQNGAEEKQKEETTLVKSEEKEEQGLSKDSCHLFLEFKGVDGQIVEEELDVYMGEDLSSLKLMSSPVMRRMDTIVRVGDYMVVVEEDTFHFPMNDYGGEVIHEDVILPYRTLKGRIMEVDGTPIAQMPLHLRISVREKGKGRKWKKRLLPEEPLVYTDSLGFYRTVVPEEVAEVSLRTSGFLVGKFVRKELLEFGAQNFLFEPFRVRNLCGNNLPQYDFYLENQDGLSIDVQDRKKLIASDSLLEDMESITMVATSDQGTLERTLKKRNKVFRGVDIRICNSD